jgi:hypothetical protein
VRLDEGGCLTTAVRGVVGEHSHVGSRVTVHLASVAAVIDDADFTESGGDGGVLVDGLVGANFVRNGQFVVHDGPFVGLITTLVLDASRTIVRDGLAGSFWTAEDSDAEEVRVERTQFVVGQVEGGDGEQRNVDDELRSDGHNGLLR